MQVFTVLPVAMKTRKGSGKLGHLNLMQTLCFYKLESVAQVESSN